MAHAHTRMSELGPVLSPHQSSMYSFCFVSKKDSKICYSRARQDVGAESTHARPCGFSVHVVSGRVHVHRHVKHPSFVKMRHNSEILQKKLKASDSSTAPWKYARGRELSRQHSGGSTCPRLNAQRICRARTPKLARKAKLGMMMGHPRTHARTHALNL
jgi:hypothetical protein